MMSAWSAWVDFAGLVSLDAPRAALDRMVAESDAILAVVHSDHERALLRRGLDGTPDHVIWPDYAPADTWDNDAQREVAHHDFELGGLNEWDGAPTRHSSIILQRLSSAHGRREFPTWAFPLERRDVPLRALDVGCGPISILRAGILCGQLTVDGLDPLLSMYALILARHGLDHLPGMRLAASYECLAEDMDRHVPAASYDVAFSNNALDHTRAPERVVNNIGAILKPGGRLLIGGATREGTRQQWSQFHKTDIWIEDGQVVYCHQDAITKPLLGSASRLRLSRIIQHTDEWLCFEAERVG